MADQGGKTHKNPIRLVFLNRKPRQSGNFSIEIIFEQLKAQLPARFKTSVYQARYQSSGFFKRLFIAIEAAFHQADINHVTGDTHFLTLFLKKKKTLLSIHDLGFLHDVTGIKALLLKKLWVDYPVKRARKVHVVSEFTRQEVLKYSGCAPDKVVVIHNPLPSAGFKFTPKQFNEEAPRILHLGCAGNKNLARLVEALKGIPCVLDIVGKAPAEIQERARALGIQHEVSWNLTEEEVIQKYEACDILSIVSTNEGFGMPIVEAQCVGRVVVTANLSSMPEVAGEGAQLVDPYDIESIADGFKRVIGDAALRNSLIEKGLENCKRFEIAHVTQKYTALYDSMLE